MVACPAWTAAELRIRLAHLWIVVGETQKTRKKKEKRLCRCFMRHDLHIALVVVFGSESVEYRFAQLGTQIEIEEMLSSTEKRTSSRRSVLSIS